MKKLILGALALLSMSWALATVNINTAGADELKALPGILRRGRGDCGIPNSTVISKAWKS